MSFNYLLMSTKKKAEKSKQKNKIKKRNSNCGGFMTRVRLNRYF